MTAGEWAARSLEQRERIQKVFRSQTEIVWPLVAHSYISRIMTEATCHSMRARLRQNINEIAIDASELLGEAGLSDGLLPPLFLGVKPAQELCEVGVVFSIPRFAHDCDECKFLGQIDIRSPVNLSPGVVDAYFCDKAGYRTLILRSSDDPPDYETMPIGIAGVYEQASNPWWDTAILRMWYIGAPT